MAEIKRYAGTGETLTVELPYSEVCMWMRVAGKRMAVQLTCERDGRPTGAQLLTKSGGHFSFPILPSEAGFYWDAEAGSYYTYVTVSAVATVAA
jgi:hypothetical protein